jgi:hypothetical protein
MSAKACISVPCPSFTEGTLPIVAVCNCHENYPHWGNPWGDENCPVHGVNVRDYIDAAKQIAEHERQARETFGLS